MAKGRHAAIRELRRDRTFVGLTVLAMLAALLVFPGVAAATPDPTSVTVAGSLQDELGCPGDWQPDCAATHLTYDVNDDVWQGVFAVPAGSWEYKATLNDSWDENYGANAQFNGANIGLSLGAPTDVKFYYDDKTHWVTDSENSRIATAAGSFQDELGCPGDWQPDCLRSWLQDPDGDGIYVFSTTAISAGNYEAKVAIDESWDENYGSGGVPNGANIPFRVEIGQTVGFSWDLASKVLTISLSPAVDTDGDGVIDADDLCPDTDLGGDTAPSRHKKNRLWSDTNGSFLFGDGTDSGITMADTGGCSASQIIEAAGLGNGHARFGISKSAMAAYLASLEQVGLLAVAWSEVDGQPGYDPAGDVLIAQFEDVDGNGTPSIGDIVRTDQYPKDQTPSGFGSFTVKEHVVGSYGFAYQTYTSTELTVGLTDDLGNIDQFSWSESSTAEGYGEISEFGFVTGFTDRFAALDEVLVEPASPSVPDGLFRPNDVIGTGDDDFINVVITPPATQ